MSEHLRTIRNAWISAMTTEDPDQYCDAITEEEAIYAFDRWIAAHDRQVKAEAQAAALREMADDWMHSDPVSHSFRAWLRDTAARIAEGKHP